MRWRFLLPTRRSKDLLVGVALLVVGLLAGAALPVAVHLVGDLLALLLVPLVWVVPLVCRHRDSIRPCSRRP